MNLHAWSPTVTAWLMPFIIMASENGVCSQGEQCVCFNMALSLLGLKCKIGGTKHWLQRRHQIGFSFYSPGKTCGGQNWQRWETFGRNWHFILYLGITKNTSKIMWGFSGFLHMQCFFFPLCISLVKAAIHLFSCCWRIYVTSIITLTSMAMKACGIFCMLYFQIFAYPQYLDSL